MGDCDREMMSCKGSRGQMGGSAQCMALETVIQASLLAPLKSSSKRDSGKVPEMCGMTRFTPTAKPF